MFTIMGYVNAVNNYRRHYSVNHGHSFIGFDENVFQSRIIPRLTILTDFENTCEYGYELKDFHRTVYLLSSNELNTECTDCQYSENCNGQMCFFSMI